MAKRQFKNTNLAWAIEQLVPVLTATLAVLIAAIGYNYSIKIQTQDYQQRYRIEAYKNISREVSYYRQSRRVFDEALIRITTNVYARELKLQSELQSYEILSAQMDKMLLELQKHAIIEPKLDLFVMAFANANLSLQSPFFAYEAAVSSYKDKAKEEKEEQRELLIKIVTKLAEAFYLSSHIDSYFETELQNALLGPIYGNDIEPIFLDSIKSGSASLKLDEYEELMESLKAEREALINAKPLLQELSGD